MAGHEEDPGARRLSRHDGLRHGHGARTGRLSRRVQRPVPDGRTAPTSWTSWRRTWMPWTGTWTSWRRTWTS